MKTLFTHTAIACMMLAFFCACSSDNAQMKPEALIQKGEKLAAKGRHADAVACYDKVIDAYGEYSLAYTRRAASKAASGDSAGAAADIVRALRGGADAKGLEVLKAIAPDCLSQIAMEVKNECTVYQTGDLMYLLGAAYEAAGMARDALNAYEVAASLDGGFASECTRLASAKDQAGTTDSDYFTRLEADGTVTTNLRFLDPYWGGPAPAGKPTAAEKQLEAETMAAGLTAPKINAGSYPELARKRNIQGTVTARVNLDGRGRLRAVRIMDGVHFTLDSETTRLLNGYEGWQNYSTGKSVSFVIPVTWSL